MPAKNHSNLEQAMTLLIQNQAAFVAHLGSMDERFARIEERTDQRFALMEARTDKRFARVEERLDKIEQLLAEHHQILIGLQEAIHALPEAIRDKIGFKPRR